jgi:hypothetical protein
MIAGFAIDTPELSAPILSLISWMREHGVDPDPANTFCPLILFNLEKIEISKVLESNPEAEIAVYFELISNQPRHYTLRETVGGRSGPWSSRTHQIDALDKFNALGLKCEVEDTSQQIIAITVSAEWLSQRNCELIGQDKGVLLLKKLNTILPDN